ncbi:hypothetical protein ACWGK6_12375 [Streptomyces violaceusniger]
MMARPALASTTLASERFGDDEPVFGTGYQLLPGVKVPVFADAVAWSGDCIGRRANFSRSDWTLYFPTNDPLASLQLREFAFSLLNPTHARLRQASIYLLAEPAPFLSVLTDCRKLRIVLRMAREHGWPADFGRWETEHWQALIAERLKEVEPKTLTGDIAAVRRLRQLTAVITGMSAFEDPWDGRPALHVVKEAVEDASPVADDGLSTPAIPPETWWPLLRAAWTYIHTFAPDILRWKTELEERAEVLGKGTEPPRKRRTPMRADEADAIVAAWLSDPANLVPLHEKPFREAPAGSPIWTTLSQMISRGQNPFLFAIRPGANQERVETRRAGVLAAVARGRSQTVGTREAGRLTETGRYRPHGAHPTRDTLDDDVKKWLSNPANLVPVRAEADEQGEAGTPILGTLARMIWGLPRYGHRFGITAAGHERRQVVEEAVAAGQGQAVGQRGSRGYRLLPLQASGAAQVTRADGSTGPWRTQITHHELDEELRMVRASCYCFIAALSMMRDSEVQEITREAVGSHFGSPAVKSRKTKKEPTRPEQFWWIIEPVAEAIAVAEKVSWHPTHLFATLEPPARGETSYQGRPGIIAGDEIDYFMDRVNATGDHLGLVKIPQAHVRPHMFRKTMSMITSREPDSEIALGLQLKHAARRAMSNRTTQAYGRMDVSWIKEFDDQLEHAAALRLVELLKARRGGDVVAVGPGAARLHAGLDKVIAAVDSDPELRAQIADERLQASLLASEFPELHLGTLNHCLFDAPQAECQNELPPDQRGRAPLIGACQPDRCRNSVITRAHAPIWAAEEEDLTAMAKEPRMAPPRREAVLIRLDDVQRITRALREEGAA